MNALKLPHHDKTAVAALLKVKPKPKKVQKRRKNPKKSKKSDANPLSEH
jgi:hypothetical protein